MAAAFGCATCAGDVVVGAGAGTGGAGGVAVAVAVAVAIVVVGTGEMVAGGGVAGRAQSGWGSSIWPTPKTAPAVRKAITIPTS